MARSTDRLEARQPVEPVGGLDALADAVLSLRTRDEAQRFLRDLCTLPELEALLPALESPTIIPLAHDGMVAVHTVIGADEVWGLLPRLKGAGASGILVLPIEKIVP